MTEIVVRSLAEDDWQVLRAVRLDALRESPDAFLSHHDTESQHDEAFWRAWTREARLFLAERDGDAVGMVGLGVVEGDSRTGEILGLWVAPRERRGQVAIDLLRAAVGQAVAEGRQRLYFWVGSDNGPAVGFASTAGFRPTSERRPAHPTPGGDGGDPGDDAGEVAMVLSLSPDPTSVMNPLMP